MTTANYLAFSAILIAPLVGYLTASRRLSGKIGTSSADQLWAESKSIREDYREQIRRANAHVTELEARIQTCEMRCEKLTKEKRVLEIQILDHEALLERIEHLEVENSRLMQLLEHQAHTTLEALHNGEEDTPDA